MTLALPALPEGLRTRARLAARAFTWAIPLATILVIGIEWSGLDNEPARDTIAYHAAAAAAREGSPIYSPKPPPGPHEYTGQWYYLYPPPFAALVALLPAMPYHTFDRLWLIANLIAFWVLAAALAKIARGSWSVEGALRWGTALFFLPGTWSAVHFGNVELCVFALVAAGLAVSRVSGATLALAAMVKLTPAWPLLTMIRRAPREVLIGAGAAAAASGAACIHIFGFDQTVLLSAEWLRDVMPTLGQGQFWGASFASFSGGELTPSHIVSNLSLSFAPVQYAVLAGWPYEGGELAAFVKLYLTAVATGVPLVTAWLTRHRSPVCQAAVVYAAALFSAPIVRPYVMPVLLLVLAAKLHDDRTAVTPSAARSRAH